MALINYSGAIAHRKRKSRNSTKKSEEVKLDPDGMKPYTQEWKDKHLKWVEDGLCASCGAPSGEYNGICDECRWS